MTSTTRHYWTDAEVYALRKTYAETDTKLIATSFERSVRQVQMKAHDLGLKKSAACIAQIARENTLRPGHGSHATRFQPGMPPGNKGTKHGKGWAPGEMAKTQFKPGDMPKNYRPVGSYRINGEGYLDMKVTDFGRHNADRWKPVHRLVWERANGPVPKGSVVIFLPGQKTTDLDLITVDRLQLVTRAELMKLNTIHRHPSELRQVMRLRGQITRAIRNANQEAQP